MSKDPQAKSQGAVGIERRGRVVHARFSHSEFSAIEAAAKLSGMNLSAFIRSLTLDGAGVAPFLTEEEQALFRLLHRDLAAIGTDLNSLLRQVHQHSMSAEIADLRNLQLLVTGLAVELRRLATRTSRMAGERG